MSDNYGKEFLSFTDAFFLYLEQPGAPVNVASISAFEGVISLDECRKYVDSRLPLIPRFLERVVTPPFGIGSPTWQVDPHFDVRNHVREVTLKRGTEAEWKSAVSQVLSTALDRSRPLWDITLFQGLHGGRTGVVVKCHHCMVDGVAGVGLLKVLLNENAAAPRIQRKRKVAQVAPNPQSAGSVLLESILNSCFATAQALLTAHSELLRMAQASFHEPSEPHTHEAHADHAPEALNGALTGIAPLGKVARLLSELARPTERLPYNVLCHGPQKFDWAELSMSDICAVKQACGATVNDVVLTVLTATLRRYAEIHDLKVKGRTLRLVVPVDVRADGEVNDTGNHITFLPVDISMGAREPRKLLSLVQERVGFSKTAHGGELVALIGMLAEALPGSLQSLAGSVLSQLPISVCNTICTNVHGPKTPLYLLGHKMLSSYPYVPIGGEMGMNCAVMSYDGSLYIGFTGDARAIPDLSRLPALFTESFAELREAVGLHIAKPRRARSLKEKSVTSIAEEPIAHAEPVASTRAAASGVA